MRFIQADILRRHVILHLNKDYIHDNRSTWIKQKTTKWKCESCGNYYRSRNILRRHKKLNCSQRKKDEIDLFKLPEIPKINNKAELNISKEPTKEKNRIRKRKNLNIKARQIINRVMHYHFNEKNKDGSITERWLPIYEIEDFNDVVEFEKFIAKIEIGSEEDLFIPKEEFFL